MKVQLKVVETSTHTQVIPMYVTPCCGGRHYLFPGEVPTCYLCGREYPEVPMDLEVERNLNHLRFQRVSRYVS